MLEALVSTEYSQDKGNFPVHSRPEENYPEWKPAYTDWHVKRLKQSEDTISPEVACVI